MAVVYKDKIITMAATDEVATPLQVAALFLAPTCAVDTGGTTFATANATDPEFLHFGERGHYFASGIGATTAGLTIFLA